MVGRARRTRVAAAAARDRNFCNAISNSKVHNHTDSCTVAAFAGKPCNYYTLCRSMDKALLRIHQKRVCKASNDLYHVSNVRSAGVQMANYPAARRPCSLDFGLLPVWDHHLQHRDVG